jgi:hypothetical protein
LQNRNQIVDGQLRQPLNQLDLHTRSTRTLTNKPLCTITGDNMVVMLAVILCPLFFQHAHICHESVMMTAKDATEIWWEYQLMDVIWEQTQSKQNMLSGTCNKYQCVTNSRMTHKICVLVKSLYKKLLIGGDHLSRIFKKKADLQKFYAINGIRIFQTEGGKIAGKWWGSRRRRSAAIFLDFVTVFLFSSSPHASHTIKQLNLQVLCHFPTFVSYYSLLKFFANHILTVD